jgi:hypothetical protein
MMPYTGNGGINESKSIGLLLTTSWAQPSRFSRAPNHPLQRERCRMFGMGFLESVKDADLPGTVHACKLYTAAVDKVQYHAVRELLNLDIGNVWCSEVAQVVAFGALSSATALRWECTQDKKALRVQAHIASFPEQVIRKLHINISHKRDDGWGSTCRRADLLLLHGW